MVEVFNETLVLVPNKNSELFLLNCNLLFYLSEQEDHDDIPTREKACELDHRLDRG